MDFTCPHCDQTTPHRIDKYCPQCEKTLPHTSYHKNRSAPDNLSAWCKACRKKKRNEPEAKEAYNAYMRGWNDRNATKVNANATAYYWEQQAKRQNDPELDEHLRALSRAKSQRAYDRDPNKANAATAAWKGANKPRVNKRRRERGKENPEKIAAQNAKSYALRRNAPINDLTADDWELIQAHFGNRCVYCPETCQACRKGTHKLTKDHITPLINGGPHTLSNIVPACRSCNGKKGKGPVLRPIQPMLL